MKQSTALLAAFLLAYVPFSFTQDLVILADTLHTSGPQGVMTDAAVFIEDGKISKVGKQSELPVPGDVEMLRASVVTPGLIDARTTLGLSGMFNVASDQDQDELSGTSQAQLRAIDSYNPREELISFVRKYGVTAVQATPGDLNLIAGQGAVFKTTGDTVEEALIKPGSSMVFNLGEAPKAAYKDQHKVPETRMASAAVIRQALTDAQHYAQFGGDGGKTDLALAALAQVVSGDMPALFTAHREDDIATALRIGREFGLTVWIHYATEGYLMRETLAASGAQVLVGPTMQRADALQTLNASYENATLMHAASIPLTFSTGHEAYVPKERVLLFEIAIAVANGLSAEEAVRGATIQAARLLGIEDRVGSVEEGKDADLVLFDGDPFEYTSHVSAVLIDGERVHER